MFWATGATLEKSFLMASAFKVTSLQSDGDELESKSLMDEEWVKKVKDNLRALVAVSRLHLSFFMSLIYNMQVRIEQKEQEEDTEDSRALNRARALSGCSASSNGSTDSDPYRPLHKWSRTSGRSSPPAGPWTRPIPVPEVRSKAD